jgi:dimethylargininase
MTDLLVITRRPGPDLNGGELAHKPRVEVNGERALEQHQAYRTALAELGALVVELSPLPGCPDAVFVEDPALVLDEVAVIARPGAASRRPEIETVARALAPHRPLLRLEAPATLDGGDLLCIEKTIFVGESARTNEAGRVALAEMVAPHGYRVEPVPLFDCLHLKSAVSWLGGDRLLVNPAWLEETSFPGFERIEVDPEEPFGANILPLAGRVLVLASCPRTAERLDGIGLGVRAIDLSEFEKMEGSLTCLSLLLRNFAASS